MKVGPGAKAILMLAGLVITVAGLKLASTIFVPMVTAVFITVVSLPVVRWLMARRLPRWAAILLAVLLDFAVLVGLGTLIASSMNAFYERVPYYQARLVEITVQSAQWLGARGLHIDATSATSLASSEKVVALVADVFQRLTSFLSNAFLVALLVLFMLFEAGPWPAKLTFILRSPNRDLPRFATAAREVQTYLVVKSALSLLTGALCGGWAALCNVDFPLLWGVLAFLLNYVPTLGMVIATIPPVVVAFIQHGTGDALLVLSGYGVINFSLGNFVEPRIMGRALGLSPLVVFLSMVFWGWLWGPVGALLAVPLTMVIKLVLANTEDLRWVAVLLGSSEWFAVKRREWGAAEGALEERARRRAAGADDDGPTLHEPAAGERLDAAAAGALDDAAARAHPPRADDQAAAELDVPRGATHPA
jgi:predicted PurR-regulated permease PerM